MLVGTIPVPSLLESEARCSLLHRPSHWPVFVVRTGQRGDLRQASLVPRLHGPTMWPGYEARDRQAR